MLLIHWYHDKLNTIKTHGHINTWDTSRVSSFEKLFYFLPQFNDDISKWDTSNVTSMRYMFNEATHFQYDIRGWNVSKVASFYGMFKNINSNFIQKYDVDNTLIHANGTPIRMFFNK